MPSSQGLVHCFACYPLRSVSSYGPKLFWWRHHNIQSSKCITDVWSQTWSSRRGVLDVGLTIECGCSRATAEGEYHPTKLRSASATDICTHVPTVSARIIYNSIHAHDKTGNNGPYSCLVSDMMVLEYLLTYCASFTFSYMQTSIPIYNPSVLEDHVNNAKWSPDTTRRPPLYHISNGWLGAYVQANREPYVSLLCGCE